MLSIRQTRGGGQHAGRTARRHMPRVDIARACCTPGATPRHDHARSRSWSAQPSAQASAGLLPAGARALVTRRQHVAASSGPPWSAVRSVHGARLLNVAPDAPERRQDLEVLEPTCKELDGGHGRDDVMRLVAKRLDVVVASHCERGSDAVSTRKRFGSCALAQQHRVECRRAIALAWPALPSVGAPLAGGRAAGQQAGKRALGLCQVRTRRLEASP